MYPNIGAEMSSQRKLHTVGVSDSNFAGCYLICGLFTVSTSCSKA